jgi:hypothetical protein
VVGQAYDGNGNAVFRAVMSGGEDRRRVVICSEGGGVLAEAISSFGRMDPELGRPVYVRGRSCADARFLVTGMSSLREIFGGFMHPLRTAYGFADTQRFFEDLPLVSALLLFEVVYNPLNFTWSTG